MRYIKVCFMILALILSFSSASFANVKQLKTYREVYPDYKPKCNYCHIEEKPSKDEGKHELNAYGQELQKLMNGEDLTKEMVESVGNHEDFKPENDESSSQDEGQEETKE